jgi:hypothetical protein
MRPLSSTQSPTLRSIPSACISQRNSWLSADKSNAVDSVLESGPLYVRPSTVTVRVLAPKPLVCTTPWYTLSVSRGITMNRMGGLSEPGLIKIARLGLHPVTSTLMSIKIAAEYFCSLTPSLDAALDVMLRRPKHSLECKCRRRMCGNNGNQATYSENSYDDQGGRFTSTEFALFYRSDPLDRNGSRATFNDTWAQSGYFERVTFIVRGDDQDAIARFEQLS